MSRIDQSGSVDLWDGSSNLGRCMPESITDLGDGKIIFIKDLNGCDRYLMIYNRKNKKLEDITKRTLSSGKSTTPIKKLESAMFIPRKTKVQNDVLEIDGDIMDPIISGIKFEIPIEEIKVFFGE